MSTLTIARAAQANAVQAYFRNVGQSAAALLAALFAVQPRKADAAVNEAPADQVSLSRLYRLACSYDTVMPSLAQELRYIARR